MLIGAFFRSNLDTTIDFYTGSDGKLFNRLCSPIMGRDPSIIYYNGFFMMLTTDYGYDSHDFAISYSKDLKDWKYRKYKVGLINSNARCQKVWASEWFLDEDGKLYIITSFSDGTMEDDIYGNNIPVFKQYLIAVNKVTPGERVLGLEFGEPIPLDLQYIPGSTNKIDAQVIRTGNTYRMFIKNEYNKNIELWSALSLDGQWHRDRRWLVTSNEVMEGPCCIKLGNRYYIYADKFESNEGTYYTTTRDFSTFTKWSKIVTIPDTNMTRHGIVYDLREDEVIKSIK